MFTVSIPSPFGTLSGTVGEGKIFALSLAASDAAFPQDAPSTEDRRTVELLCTQLDEYFSGRRRVFDLPLCLHGTGFQLAVWNAMRRIPYGEVRTYGEVAWMAGYPRAARAVGNACNRNPVLLLVPCHRVVASDGIGGFAHRTDIKRALLRLEGNTAYEPTF